VHLFFILFFSVLFCAFLCALPLPAGERPRRLLDFKHKKVELELQQPCGEAASALQGVGQLVRNTWKHCWLAG
jgi:hypothetical protein